MLQLSREKPGNPTSDIYMGCLKKLATSVNQGDTILTMMGVLKCTQITLLKSYWTTARIPILNTFLH